MSLLVYTKTGCPWCEDVVKFLHERTVSFEEREVYGNEEYFKELIEKSGQKKAPTLDLDGVILADTDKESVEKFLIDRGVLGI